MGILRGRYGTLDEEVYGEVGERDICRVHWKRREGDGYGDGEM